MGERREKRKKNNKSYQEFQTSQPPKIVGGCNCDTYVATSESILQPPVATQGCDFSQPKKNKVATKFLQPPKNNKTPLFIHQRTLQPPSLHTYIHHFIMKKLKIVFGF